MATTQFPESPFHRRDKSPKHWSNAREMHRAMHKFPGLFRAVLLEFLDHPLTRSDVRECLQKMGLTRSAGKKIERAQLNLEKDLILAKELGVLEEKDGRYFLTAAGREMAEHIQWAIPTFMTWLYSAETASLLSIWVHIILSGLKLITGLITRSAGLIADGIDNSVDTVSAFLVWLGIKHDKERLASVFILLTMFISCLGVAWAAYQKIVHLGPVKAEFWAFIISALCGVTMLGLSSYQYMVGHKRSNLAILCQAVDSRNHFLTSLLVCLAILLSYLAGLRQTPWLYYADAAASTVIGLLILSGAVELAREVFKITEEPAEISHFLRRSLQNQKEKIIFKWLKGQLQTKSLEKKELARWFIADFCDQKPKVLILSGMGYQPENEEDLDYYLDKFIQQKKLVADEGKFWLIGG